jgi:hypothetical protein
VACYSPIQAYRNPFDHEGPLLFSPPHPGFSASANIALSGLKIPCGRCIGCRLEYSRQWAMRCHHEASLHIFNSFITLTYDPEHLPEDGSLNVLHFQKFMKRLRKKIQPLKIRFFHCGEYGDKTRRPHYHALIFGYGFPDKKIFKKQKSGDLFTSDILTKCWGKGHCLVGDLTFESAAYVARYVVKKINGQQKFLHYAIINHETGEFHSLKQEYTTMSRRPGIAADWFAKYYEDVYPSDSVYVNGRVMRPPKYYDILFKKLDPALMEQISDTRRDNFNPTDCTPERLKVREICAQAKLSQCSRDAI